MALQVIALDSVSPRSKVIYDKSSMKKTTVNRSPVNQNRRNSAGNGRRPDNRQQKRRSDVSTVRRQSFHPQQQSRPDYHQRRSGGQQHHNNRQLQRRSDSYVDRRSPKNNHVTKTIHEKQATKTRSPKNRRPNKKPEVKPTVENLDRELEAYMKRPVSA
uniref:FoP_duplication domain-containing protein n=1 Tax=Panagrellus redivivus TaxID=6233 RepID=A0A7E4V2W4_PANRE